MKTLRKCGHRPFRIVVIHGGPVPEMARDLAQARLTPALLKLWPYYLGFLLSFFVIGNYWPSHGEAQDHSRILAALRPGDLRAARQALKADMRTGRTPILTWLTQGKNPARQEERP